MDVVSTFSSVFLIHMEEHLLESVKMLSLTSAGQLVSQVHWYSLFLSPLRFNLFRIELAYSFGKLTASYTQLDTSFIDSEKVLMSASICALLTCELSLRSPKHVLPQGKIIAVHILPSIRLTCIIWTMCLLSHLHSTSLFPYCSLFVIWSAKLMMLYLF